MLDRIDLHVAVSRPPTSALRDKDDDNESSERMRQRVQQVYDLQQSQSGVSNARLSGDELQKFCKVSETCWTLLERAAERFNLSARSHQRILRVARTIADLAGDKNIAPPHIAEALSLRCLDRRADRY